MHLIEVARTFGVQQLGCQLGVQPICFCGGGIALQTAKAGQHTHHVGIHSSHCFICSYGGHGVADVGADSCISFNSSAAVRGTPAVSVTSISVV